MSTDLVAGIILRDVPRIVRNAFLSYLANALILVILANLGVAIYGSVAATLGMFLQVFGFVVTGYAGIVYAWTKFRLSKGLDVQLFLLGFLGICQGGLLYSAAAYQLLSGAHWLRQVRTKQVCKCTRDNGDVVAFAGEFLACPKCSRKVRVGYDIPKIWSRVGQMALVIGVLLYILRFLISGQFGTSPLAYLGGLLLLNGIIFSIGTPTIQSYLGGFVRFPSQSTLEDTNPVTR
jgi:hypothetical protein